VEIVRRTREAVGRDFILIFRLSMLDLVEGGSRIGRKSVPAAKAIEAAGATIINTGIGWHEARVPSIVTRCRARPSRWVTRKLKARGLRFR
jgi:2,4-dienoyl-CoA reductase (NADPH2)